jgi:2-polyprenyl-6-hydroxyphenyl methylase/3-demethylubiquinone-9 3-methyltransferase
LNLLKLLKPTVILILSTINRTIKSYTQAIIAAEYILKWVPTNTHDYSKFLKPSELNKIIKQTDFYLKDLTGLKFNPLTSNWYLSDDIDVNYFACIAK